MKRVFWRRLLGGMLLAMSLVLPTAAQPGEAMRGSRNVARVGHLAMAGGTYVEMEQEAGRPYAYVARPGGRLGFDVIDLTNPAHPAGLHAWEIEHPEMHTGTATDVAYFRHSERVYLVQAFQFEAGTPDHDLGAIVFDVTDLPGGIEEVARIQGPDVAGGILHLFPYRHSDGRALLFATGGGDALVYDLAEVLTGGAAPAARIATPETLRQVSPGFQTLFAGFHPDTAQDRLYAAGADGYYVFDVTAPAAPTLLASVSTAAVRRGQNAVPTPDGRYLVTAAEYRAAPLRIFDLQPVFDGEVSRIRTEVGAWTSDWRGYAQHYELRWPYLFVAALDDGFQMVNLRDAEHPYTTAFYDTYTGPPSHVADDDLHGAWDLDVRNSDGLILVSDLDSGLWLFRVDFFKGWDGRGWGFPNVSSVQQW